MPPDPPNRPTLTNRQTPTNRPTQLDVVNDPSPPSQPQRGRPFLGIRFECCRTYRQINLNRSGTAYEGRCPKCQASVRVPVGPGGSSSRFFSAG